MSPLYEFIITDGKNQYFITKEKTTMKNQNYLITALKILGIFFLLPIVISCGWIIGAIWLARVLPQKIKL